MDKYICGEISGLQNRFSFKFINEINRAIYLLTTVLFFSFLNSGKGCDDLGNFNRIILPAAADFSDISFNLTGKESIADTIKSNNGSSLDGQQNIKKPGIEAKPFDPEAPFNKLTFRMLRTYIPGKICPEDLKKFSGQNVEILGFMTPLNALENMDEFLLCSAPPLSCYCAPPIFINEIVYVKLIDKRTDFKTGAVKIRGQFNINFDIKDEYSDIIYTIEAVEIE